MGEGGWQQLDPCDHLYKLEKTMMANSTAMGKESVEKKQLVNYLEREVQDPKLAKRKMMGGESVIRRELVGEKWLVTNM